MKITEDVRKYAAEQGIAEEKALESGIEPTGVRRDRRASPRGREGRAAFESMQEKRTEFQESGAEVYAKAYLLWGARAPRVLATVSPPSRTFVRLASTSQLR